MNNPLLYTDPTGYTWKIFKPFEKAWNWFWDKGDQFATWAAQTDWVPSSGGAGVNSAGEIWHSVGESGPIYHNQLGNDYEGVVKEEISGIKSSSACYSIIFKSS